MNENNHLNNFSKNQVEKAKNAFLSNDNTVAIYTILSILIRMQQTLGLEAMLEYIKEYLSMIEQRNPQIKEAVEKALKLMSVEKMYREAVGYNEKS